jgi:hypothetical protein
VGHSGPKHLSGTDDLDDLVAGQRHLGSIETVGNPVGARCDIGDENLKRIRYQQTDIGNLFSRVGEIDDGGSVTIDASYKKVSGDPTVVTPTLPGCTTPPFSPSISPSYSTESVASLPASTGFGEISTSNSESGDNASGGGSEQTTFDVVVVDDSTEDVHPAARSTNAPTKTKPLNLRLLRAPTS